VVDFVTRLSLHGVTRVEIFDLIMGDLWDSTMLMKRGQNVRNDTIVLTRARLIQIISKRGRSGSSDRKANYASIRPR
jgi:hypothetical protein